MVLIFLLLSSLLSSLVNSAAASGIRYGELSLSQWQDSFTLNTPGQPATKILEEPFGICPGAGYRDAISSDWAWDVNGCVFLGTAEANVDNTIGSSSTYSSKNNLVYGIESGFGFLWSPGGIKHQIGIEIPLLIRHVSPGSAGPGTNFSSTTAVQTGLELDFRFYSAHSFWFDPKLAWFQTSHTAFWALNFGLDF